MADVTVMATDDMEPIYSGLARRAALAPDGSANRIA